MPSTRISKRVTPVDRLASPGGTIAGRRSFLLGAAAVLGGAPALKGQQSSRRAEPSASLPDPLSAPNRVDAFGEGPSGAIRLTRSGDKWQGSQVEVATELRTGKGGTERVISLSAPKTTLTRLRLRWHGSFPAGCRFLGDHWERSYGDLEWRGLAGERLMPWYFLAQDGRATHGFGVKTGAASICHWQADAGGMTLWLDVSNGGGAVELGVVRRLFVEYRHPQGHATSLRALGDILVEDVAGQPGDERVEVGHGEVGARREQRSLVVRTRGDAHGIRASGLGCGHVAGMVSDVD